MNVLLLVSVLVVMLPATAALVHAVRCAADGYEDERQFHAGARPAPAAAAVILQVLSVQYEATQTHCRPQLVPSDPAGA